MTIIRDVTHTLKKPRKETQIFRIAAGEYILGERSVVKDETVEEILLFNLDGDGDYYVNLGFSMGVERGDMALMKGELDPYSAEIYGAIIVKAECEFNAGTIGTPIGTIGVINKATITPMCLLWNEIDDRCCEEKTWPADKEYPHLGPEDGICYLTIYDCEDE